MLTISLDRLSNLLTKAADVDLTLPLPADDEEPDATGDEIVVEDAVDDAAYEDLLQALRALQPREQQELMALALLARNDSGADEWESMLEEAGTTLRDVDILGELARVMLLTDEIETALDSLGIDVDFDNEPSEEEAGEEQAK